MLVRVVNYEEIFGGQPLPVEKYLEGISRQMLLTTAVYLLGFRGVKPYAQMLPRLFGSHNQEFKSDLENRLREIEQQEKAIVVLVGEVAKLRFFELIFHLPDGPMIQSEPEMERNVFKALVALNYLLDAEYEIASTNAPALPGITELTRLILINTHTGYDLKQEQAEELVVAQMYKFIRLFQFLDADIECAPLLAAFLSYFGCESWQEYAQRLFRLVTAVIEMLKRPGWMKVVIPAGPDFAVNCAFLDHFTLAEGTTLIRQDFLSTREFPLYKSGPGEYIIVYPRFVLELLHKGLFFRLKKLNEAVEPRLLGKREWASLYKKSFSEEMLLTPALDAALKPRGIALSGKEIEDGGFLKKLNNGEPDYYFRAGKRVLLIESKDVNLNKDVKTGEKFAEFVEALRSKFYRPSGQPRTDKLSGTAVLQLFNNIKRLLSYGLPFDTNYTAKNLIFYPIIVVHDRSFTMPGLNALVNSWFQEELAYQRQQGMTGGIIRPLVIIDIDTVLAYQDHFARRDNKLVLWEAIEAYYAYMETNFRVQKPRNLDAQSTYAQIWTQAERQATSFYDFLSYYAGSRLKLAPFSDTQHEALKEFLTSPAYNIPLGEEE